jgi:ribosome-binding factor A
MRSSCNEIGPEDGADPRIFFRKRSEQKTNRKALQLCREVQRTLSNVLSWEQGDDLLRSLQVESVVPAPDSSHLLVTVYLQAGSTEGGLEQIQQRLRRITGTLRAEIAAAVSRRRVPELTFRVVGATEVKP